MRRLSSREFFDRLRRRTRSNARAVDRRILDACAGEAAVLMADAVGFSRRTHEEGILSFLSAMTRGHDRLVRVISGHGGRCFSREADNLLAGFDECADAVEAGLAMVESLREWNRGRRRAERFEVCIGIHYGPVVRLRDDVYGPTVNVAAKVGEDLAGPEEVLVTSEVAERVRGVVRTSYSRTVSIGGRPFELYRVRERTGGR